MYFFLSRSLALAVIILGIWQRPVHAARDWTLSEVKELVDETRARTRSISFEADVRQRLATTPKGVYRRQHINFAAEGERRFHEAGHFVDNLAWNEEPMWVRHYLLPDRVDLVWLLSRISWETRQGSDPKNNAKLRYMYFENYLLSIGWWPPGCSPELSELVPESSLHRVVRHPECQVLPGTVVIDGRSCISLHVDGRGEYLRLDPDRGGALVRRQFQLPDGSHSVTENRGFREVSPGVWLPTDVRQAVFRGEFASLDEVPEASMGSYSRYQLARVEANHVEDGQFTYEPEPGTIIDDRDSNRTTYVPGGTDLIDGVLRSGRKRIEPKIPATAGFSLQFFAILPFSVVLTMMPWFLKIRRPHVVGVQIK